MLVVIAIIIIAVIFLIKYNSDDGGGSSAPKEVKAKILTSNYKGKISFILEVRDMDGKKLKYVRKENRKLMNAPRVIVTDKDGKEVLTFNMRYG